MLKNKTFLYHVERLLTIWVETESQVQEIVCKIKNH